MVMTLVFERCSVDPALCDGSVQIKIVGESSSRHVSDTDVYMEFDDGYIEGICMKMILISKLAILLVWCKSMGHSYGVAYAEDIMFVTVKVRNEWCILRRERCLSPRNVDA